jgi:hypothetical protein
VIKALNAVGIDCWFRVYPSQFYVEFDVFVMADDLLQARDVFAATDTYQGFSTAGRMEAALKGLAAK